MAAEMTDIAEWSAPQGTSAHLRRVTESNTAVRRAQIELRETVETARNAGCTWDAIADALSCRS